MTDPDFLSLQSPHEPIHLPPTRLLSRVAATEETQLFGRSPTFTFPGCSTQSYSGATLHPDFLGLQLGERM